MTVTPTPSLSVMLHVTLNDFNSPSPSESMTYGPVFTVESSIFTSLQDLANSKKKGLRLDSLTTIKDTVHLRGCPSQKKKDLTRYLRHNYHKLYINGKVIKCTIRQKLFRFKLDPIQMEDVSLRELIAYQI